MMLGAVHKLLETSFDFSLLQLQLQRNCGRPNPTYLMTLGPREVANGDDHGRLQRRHHLRKGVTASFVDDLSLCGRQPAVVSSVLVLGRAGVLSGGDGIGDMSNNKTVFVKVCFGLPVPFRYSPPSVYCHKIQWGSLF